MKKTVMRLLQRFFRSQSGNVTLIATMAAVPVFGSLGVAIDYVRANQVSTEVSAALDSAVLAGAMAAKNSEGAAQRHFMANFPVPGVEIDQITFTKSGNTKITGRAKLKFATSFASLLGVKTIAIDVTAVAQTDSSGPGLCVLALSPNESQSLLANSGADVNASGCEIHVKSTANPAAILNSGISLQSNKLCIQGNNIINNGGSATNLQTGCSTLADPYAGKIPAPASLACDFNDRSYSGNVTLNPGVYCGWQNFNSGTNVTLNRAPISSATAAGTPMAATGPAMA